MFGSILSSVVKIATLPLDIVNGAGAALDGNDPANKQARTQIPILGDLEAARDKMCEIIESVDK